MSDLCPEAVSQNSANLADQPKTAGESHLLLLKQKKYCDVTFTFRNLPDVIQAHEFCLKSRSPVFEQIFGLRKSGHVQGTEIQISGSTPERFQQFLEFIYVDKFDVDLDGALELLQLAQKYQIQPLTDKCEEFLKFEIKLDVAVRVFEAARRHGHHELMDRAGEIMVKSFRKLAKMDTWMNAEVETVTYLLERDDLSVQEVGLFQCVLDWGRNKVGNSAGEKVLMDVLKNVIPKIRYTNMTQLEFTTVVVPTGLLSAEEIIFVYSYLCRDEVTRRELKIEFNTTSRKVEKMEKLVHFYAGQYPKSRWSVAISKQCLSFKAERTEAATEGWPDYLLKKAVITGIRFESPYVNASYRDGTFLNFNISIKEHSGTLDAEHFTLRFQKVLINCKGEPTDISVEPPVDLNLGKTFSIIVEDLSTSDPKNAFRKDREVYHGASFLDPNREVNWDLEDAKLTFSEIQRSTEYRRQSYVDKQLAFITGITIGLV